MEKGWGGVDMSGCVVGRQGKDCSESGLVWTLEYLDLLLFSSNDLCRQEDLAKIKVPWWEWINGFSFSKYLHVTLWRRKEAKQNITFVCLLSACTFGRLLCSTAVFYCCCDSPSWMSDSKRWEGTIHSFLSLIPIIGTLVNFSAQYLEFLETWTNKK